MNIPTVTTKRLTLRGWREDDLDNWARIMADERAARWVGGGPLDRAESWRLIALFLGHWSLRGYGPWAAEETATGALVGRIGLWRPEGWPGLEVGWLIDPERWNEGLATEGGRASVEWAFTHLDVEEVVSVTRPENAASRRVMHNVGLRGTGRMLELGGYQQAIYRITKADWERG